MLYIVSKLLNHPSKDACKIDLESVHKPDIFGTDFQSILGPFFGLFCDPKSIKKRIKDNINFGVHFWTDFGRFWAPSWPPAPTPYRENLPPGVFHIVLGRLGANLGPLEALLGPTWAVLGPSWGQVVANLGRFWLPRWLPNWILGRCWLPDGPQIAQNPQIHPYWPGDTKRRIVIIFVFVFVFVIKRKVRLRLRLCIYILFVFVIILYSSSSLYFIFCLSSSFVFLYSYYFRLRLRLSYSYYFRLRLRLRLLYLCYFRLRLRLLNSSFGVAEPVHPGPPACAERLNEWCFRSTFGHDFWFAFGKFLLHFGV